jgi:capsular polysaccharide biosynthesis protein
MIPRKLAETICRRFWLLLLPIAAVPLLALVVARPQPEYQSQALIWVTSPINGNPLLGTYNPYLSPAQNQVNGLNDLLTSETFRTRVALDAGIAEQEEGEKPKERYPFSITSFPKGTNIMAVVGRAQSPDEAQDLVTATLVRFGEAAQEQAEREAGLGEEYYRQQLAVAERDLEARRADVNAYLAENPAAANPGSAAALNIDFQTLQREVERQAQTVSDLERSLQTVEFRRVSAPQSQEVSFIIQDEPSLPDAALPTSLTSRLAMPAAGLFLGLLISVSYVYALFRTDHSLVSNEDVTALGAPVLAEIPDLQPLSHLAGVPALGWLIQRRYRHFARRTASYISAEGHGGKAA